jgi:DNA replication protein DnaC
VTRRPEHAEPAPIDGLLAETMEGVRRNLTIVPAGTLAPVEDPAAELLARWERLCPSRWHSASLDTLPADLRRDLAPWLERLASRGDPGNLLLSGKIGVGKTWAAFALARVALGRMTVRFASVSALLDSLRPDGDGLLSWYTNAGLLILDDLGAERLTDWGVEQLYLIVNDRWMHCRPIVATSNLSPDQIAERIGGRTWDRFRDGAEAVGIAGESRRRSLAEAEGGRPA